MTYLHTTDLARTIADAAGIPVGEAADAVARITRDAEAVPSALREAADLRETRDRLALARQVFGTEAAEAAFQRLTDSIPHG